MKLIIDTYEIPASSISHQIYKTSNLKHITLHSLLNEPLVHDCVYYVHSEECDTRLIKYYFSEVVEVKSSVVYINKVRKVVKYYSVDVNGCVDVKDFDDRMDMNIRCVDGIDFDVDEDINNNNINNFIDNNINTTYINNINTSYINNINTSSLNNINTSIRNTTYINNINNKKIILKEIVEQVHKNKTSLNKNNFLPHLLAQEDEIVIFPDEDEDEY